IKLLENRSDTQRDAIDAAYKRLYGKTLDQEYGAFLKGDDLARFKATLHRQDGNISSQNADRVFTALEESKNWVSGRSTAQIEKDIRDSVRTGDPAAMEQRFQSEHNGMSLRKAVLDNPNISDATKDAVRMYLDRDTKGMDYSKLAGLALQA